MKKVVFALVFVSFIFSNSYAQKPVVGPLMTSTWQTFQWPLNAAFPTCSDDTYGAVNGHLGNSCGPTAIAKLLHYHRHPVHGEGVYSMTDEFGIYHSINFENTYYKWNLMRDGFTSSASADIYMPTAELVYHAYGLMEDPLNTGRSLYDVCNMLKKHMRYNSAAYVAYRFDYTTEEYVNLLKSELDAGRPLLIESWTENSTPPGESGNHAGHYWNIDGYDDQDRFHIVLNVDYDEGWYPIDGVILPDFDAYYIWALIQAKPDNTGKKFAFTQPAEGYMFKIGEGIDLTWEHQNIENVHIDFSYNGTDWITIGEDISAASGSLNWDGPTQSSRNASIRVRDAGNEYYDYYFDGYETYDQEKLSLVTPGNTEKYQNGTKVCLAWEYDGVHELKFECKESDSDDWQMVERSIPAKDRFKIWPLPAGSGRSYDFRLSTTDDSFVVLSENVLVVSEEQTGGPYKTDYESMFLMHFDNNLDEECSQLESIVEGVEPTFDYSAPGKGAALCFDNSDRINQSALVIPHEDYLSMRGSYTVDLWFKINSWDIIATNKPLLVAMPYGGVKSNYSLSAMASRGSLIFRSNTTAGEIVVESSQGIIVPGVWYHAAIIHDQTTREMKLLVHNARKERIDEQTGSYPDGAGLVTGTYDLLIGKKTTLTSYLDGCVDELRISRSVRDFNANWTGVEELVVENEIRIYPNPTSDMLHIELPDGLRVTGCRLHDIVGKVVMGFTDTHKGRVRTYNVSGLSAGLYWLVVETEDGRYSEKVVIR